MNTDLFESTDDQWVRLEVRAWVEALTSFQRPLVGVEHYRESVQTLLAGAKQYLSQVSDTQIIDESVVAGLRAHVKDLLSRLSGLAEPVFAAFSIIRTRMSLEIAVEEAANLAREPMSSAEKEELRTSLSKCVQGFGDRLAALKRNLDAGDATGGGPPVGPNDDAPK